MTSADEEQLTLVGAPRRACPRTSAPIADELPVARVLLDVPLPHLDHPFDYLVPESMAADAQPGVRVAVRFAGTDHQGFIVARLAQSDHSGKLARLRRVISPEPVLAPQIAALARAVADRYAGTVADVLRLAVPPRHARAEAAEPATPLRDLEMPHPADWADHADGAALLKALHGDGAPRAVWNPGPGANWPDLLARLALSAVHGGRGALIVLPDARDVARVDSALRELAGDEQAHIVLTADLGPEERYRRWLTVRRGAVRAVVGTRSAMFAPVAELGLVAIWDDGDDLHAEPRAPYPHARDVLLLRAHHEGAGAVVGGFARTAEAEALVVSGWARPVAPSREAVRTAAPRIQVSGDDYETARDAGAKSARLPSVVWRTARDALLRGPVLVQVPRTGYVPGVACEKCRRAARCEACRGPIELRGPGGTPLCGWCGSTSWTCQACGGATVRALSVGVGRTAEELGRAFPGVAVRVSRGDAVLGEVEPSSALVVATPGAEPIVPGGYAAALLLDARAQLARADLRVEEEALRRWFGAATLVRPAGSGGEVVIVGDASALPVQALVRWDPGGFASRELATRNELHFPPMARVAELTGAAGDVSAVLELAELPRGAEVLGPVPIEGADSGVRTIVRVPRSAGGQLAASLKAAQGVRSAKRSGSPVRVRIDPVELG